MPTTRKPISARTRFAVLAAGGFRCRYCGKRAPLAYLHVDHVVPISQGGSDHPRNLVVACDECNRGKSDTRLQQAITWAPVIGDGSGGRCADEIHHGPWTEVPYGAGDEPYDSEVALVCERCHFILATRTWPT
jgi:5-methylcytosine-specific restriction endonuclease McrA